MGGKWPGRLASMCSELVGEYEDREMELYREWRAREWRDMVELLCRNQDRSAGVSTLCIVYICEDIIINSVQIF